MRYLITAIIVAVAWSPLPSNATTSPNTAAFVNRKSIVPAAPSLLSSSSTSSIEHLLYELRGGASKSKRKSSNKSSSSKNSRTITGSKKIRGSQKNVEKLSIASKNKGLLEKYKAILPMTRLYITSVGIFTLLGAVLGEEGAQEMMALDPIRTIYGLELWRIPSAASYLGKLSVGWLMSAYYLYEYGSAMERIHGTGQHLIFVLLQITMLSVFSMALGVPFFGSSIITSMLHCLSRSVPRQDVKWLIFTVPYWSLPYGLMLADVLQQGAMASLPHLMGMLTGHFYYYHKFIWPKMPGGEDWLAAPDWLKRRLEPSGFDDQDDGRKQMERVLKKRKKGKGRKLSG